MKPVLTKIHQICMVVKDAEKVVKTYSDIYGIGPWIYWEYNPSNVKDMITNYKKTEYKMLLAITKIGGIEVEFVQPLDNISIYADFLKKHGEGLHHIGYTVENYDETVKFFREKGIEIYQSGNWAGKIGRLIYTYFYDERELKHIAEILNIEPEFIVPAADKVYPPEDQQGNAMKPFFQKIMKLAFVVKSVDETVRAYADSYGIGPWQIWELNPTAVKDMKINGERADYELRVATSNIGDIEIELIEPLDDVSICAKHLKEHGEGFHHVAYRVDNFDEAIKYFKSKGIEEYQSGKWYGKYNYVLMKSEKDLKQIVEIYNTQPGFKYPAPIEVYPKK